ncbi:ATP-dependent zinc metalloprotease FtsH [Miniphocaeibacter massiliensis]|uniref:ATP-dependent zinc metalloprotease FtsH n=1 Tax=Miniphocaeibacter massiliensis TaxID=2041841 RepID=UPI000C068936|nr:ATP-dependent zinc metalloprotease FtsH [Miniphocaeibacter massiliensis]
MRKNYKSIFYYIGPIIIIALLMTFLNRNITNSKEITVNEFIKYIETTKVKEITEEDGKYIGVLKDKDKTNFEVYISGNLQEGFYDNYLKDPIENEELTFSMSPKTEGSLLSFILPTMLTIVIIGVFWYVIMSQNQNKGGSSTMNFGKNRAKLIKDEANPVTFSDVAGLKEEKEELSEIVDFLKNPKKYVDIGARIPKGILLVGPPGTGKTYLSKAVAGEAKVPFYSISGSDFVEMYVGVGASRVRDLFKDAKKDSPCIIFIDEIDAVGRKRGAGMGGGHDEREQTLNQLLVEMDGFGKNEGIIVMAATNRPDILDPAILRPGRFDRQVFVGIPDVREREAILLVHTRNKKMDPDVDLKAIAKTTSGFTPADLENLCNEAALLSARNNLKSIPKWIFEEAAIKVVAGPEKKSAVVVEKERVLTAYHEAGHAIVSRLLPDTDPVHMVTIVPRGRAGGFTAFSPKEDRNYQTKNGMKHELITLLGGRAAEYLVLDDISTGASNDIERATKIAKAMVTKYGMSEKLGPIMYGSDEDEVFMGKDFGRIKDYSEEIAYEIDKEVKRLIDEAFSKCVKLLKENVNLLHKLAKVLLDKETIDSKEFEKIYFEYSEEKDLEEPPKTLKEIQEIERNIKDLLDGDSEMESE